MKKGFTLIELLAVIVIVAIIALIAIPIVLSIINDSKESVTLRNAEYYMDAVEQSIMKKSMDIGISYTPSECLIQENGNLFCNNKDELKVEVKGKKASDGIIVFDKGKVDSIILVIENKIITTDENGVLVYVDTNLKYKVGQEVKFDPGDGEKAWNVIGEDATTVTLMLTENLGNAVVWYAYSNHNSYDNSYGPKDALEYLNSLTLEWDNVYPIRNYTYINNSDITQKTYGYQKIEIRNGVTNLTHKDGITITEVAGESKARILTREEVFEIASKTNENLTEENLKKFISDNLGEVNFVLQARGTQVELTSVDEMVAFVIKKTPSLANESKYIQIYYTVLEIVNEYGINSTHDMSLPNYLYQNLHSSKVPYAYWTLSSNIYYSSNAWSVRFVGSVYDRSVYIEERSGVRPVITVLKSASIKLVE